MTPRLACNYSLPLLDLLAESRVRLDYVKLSMYDHMEEQLARVRPFAAGLLHTLPHCGLSPAAVERVDWRRLNVLIAQSGSPFVGVHLDVKRQDWERPIEPVMQDGRQVQALRERSVANLQRFQELLEVPLLIENVPYNPAKWRLRTVFDPVFIRQVLREAAVDLLLDLGHARCAADYLGVDACDYLAALPLERVRELHLNGPRRSADGILLDRHYAMQETDFDLLTWTLERCTPEIVTLEYGGVGTGYDNPARNGKEALRSQLERIGQILRTQARAEIAS